MCWPTINYLHAREFMPFSVADVSLHLLYFPFCPLHIHFQILILKIITTTTCVASMPFFFPETYSCSTLVAFTILTACHSMHLSSRVTRCCNSFPCFLCTLIASCSTNTVSYQAFLNVQVWLKWVCCLLLSNMKECDAETAHLIGAVSCAFFVYNRLQTFHPICTETGTQ